MRIFAAAALCIIFLCFAGAALLFYKVCARRRGHPVPHSTPARPLLKERLTEGKEWFLSQPYQTITMRSEDGICLSAYYLPADSDTTLILMHGYHAEPLYEFCPLLRFYHEQGYNLLLPAARAHENSEGRFLSFGIKERRDVIGWAEYLNEHFAPRSIFYSGISMGGATVTMTAALQNPSNVRGIIADCPYGDPKAQLRYSLSRQLPLLQGAVLYLFGVWSRLLGGWHFDEFCIEDLADARLPLLILHGTADPVVPHAMSEDIAKHYGGPCERILFEGFAHAYASIHSQEKYRAAVCDFLKKYN